MAELIAGARTRLQDALTETFDEERARFDRLLPGSGRAPGLAADLRDAAAAVRASPRRGRRPRHDPATATRTAARRMRSNGVSPRSSEAADAGGDLGLATEAARAAHDDAVRADGLPVAMCIVLAFVGGTGVGKSTLLNALAGETVSPASVRRPTTSQPVAWVPADERSGAGRRCSSWLGVQDVREHGANDLGPVAILDLPDMDSVASEHRVRVEAILPRVDAVAWVTDPEKYHDAALHDDFLRAWLPRLARQVVDRSTRRTVSVPRMGGGSVATLKPDLAAARSAGRTQVQVLLTSAAPDAGRRGLRAVAVRRGRGQGRSCGPGWPRPWSTSCVASPATPASIRAGPRRRSSMPGRDRRRSRRPWTPSCASVDLPGLERQAEAATRARARARGTGPMGRITSLAVSGVRSRDAGRRSRRLPRALARPRSAHAGRRGDPHRCRRRFGRPARPFGRSLPRPWSRPSCAAGSSEPSTGPSAVSVRSSRRPAAVVGHRVPADARDGRYRPGRRMDRDPGILGGPAPGSVEVPIFGSCRCRSRAWWSCPRSSATCSRGCSGSHAGWIGRRWARRVRDRVAAAVQDEVSQRGLSPLDALEDARRRLWMAATQHRPVLRPPLSGLARVHTPVLEEHFEDGTDQARAGTRDVTARPHSLRRRAARGRRRPRRRRLRGP